MIVLKNIRLLDTLSENRYTDILISDRKIVLIAPHIDVGNLPVEILDGEGAIATPGLIDIHVHTSGGGGQTGFRSLAPEVKVRDLIQCGTTSVVGTLGTDGFVKVLPQLYAKTMSLRGNNISAYMLTGFYGLPTPTLTDSIANDLILVDPVIGCKIAICDDRSAFPDEKQLLSILNQVRLGGFTSGKRGTMHVHLGALPEGMQLLLDIAEKYPTFVPYISPTHVIRTEFLFNQGLEFAKMGGMIDLTTGGTKFAEPYIAVLMALENNVPIEQITFSSDGNGGVKSVDPDTGETRYRLAPLEGNLAQVRKLITQAGIEPKEAFKLITANAAKTMALPRKGHLKVGFDADICLFDDTYNLTSVFANGKLMMKNGIAKSGNFEA
ncbi:MAG: amidohydrolase family protein [Capnocytophaga sp.]|nr:amidohydrolase family protein [Capnocytophaga sp.]